MSNDTDKQQPRWKRKLQLGDTRKFATFSNFTAKRRDRRLRWIWKRQREWLQIQRCLWFQQLIVNTGCNFWNNWHNICDRWHAFSEENFAHGFAPTIVGLTNCHSRQHCQCCVVDVCHTFWLASSCRICCKIGIAGRWYECSSKASKWSECSLCSTWH